MGKKTNENMSNGIDDKVRKIAIYKLGGDIAGSPDTALDIAQLMKSCHQLGDFTIPIISAAKSGDYVSLVKDVSGYDFLQDKGKSKISVTDVLLGFKSIFGYDLNRGSKNFKKILTDIHYTIISQLNIEGVIIKKPTREKIPGKGRVHEYKTKDMTIEEAIESEVNSVTGLAAQLYESDPGRQMIDKLVAPGDFMAAMIYSALLNKNGIQSRPVTGREIGLVTDKAYGDANIDLELSRRFIRHSIYNQFIKREVSPVIAGFGGVTLVDEQYIVTTIGRSGTDTTATVVYFALHHLPPNIPIKYGIECMLLKDTKGCYTGDPKIVGEDAKTIPYLPYKLAAEAGNLHDKAILPLQGDGLKVKVIDYKHPEQYTLIGPENKDTGKKVYLVLNPEMVYVVGVNKISTTDRIIQFEGIMKDHGIHHRENLIYRSHETEPSILLIKGIEEEKLDRVLAALNREDFPIEQLNKEPGKKPHKKAHYIRAVGKIGYGQSREFNDIIVTSVGEEAVLRTSRLMPQCRHTLSALVNYEGFDPIGLTKMVHDKLVLPYVNGVQNGKS